MDRANKTLLEQMRINEFEIDQRKHLFYLAKDDVEALKSAKELLMLHIDDIVDRFYKQQTSIPEIALIIGDADTLERLKEAQHKYLIDLVSGLYGVEYVNNRLRIGLVHKRIGVDPKLYLSGIYTLKKILFDVISRNMEEVEERNRVLDAFEKLLLFDISLVFDTYIRSLLSELEIAKERSDQYSHILEEKVKERTQQLEELSRTDPLTGLLNVRQLTETLTATLLSAERRGEPVSMVYIDIDDFKLINDTHGHQQGDEILCSVSSALKHVSRQEDSCFRYGGDEFCVILPNCSEELAKEIYTKRLIDEIKKSAYDISLSIGIVQTGPQEYLEPDALIHKADHLMYAEKKRVKQPKIFNSASP